MSNSVQICGADIPSEVFEWLAKGQQIQTNICGWTTCSAEGVLRQILNGNTTFRLKPRTVKIGSREVEAPVLEPVKMTHVFFLDTSSVGEKCSFNSIVYNPVANPPNIEQLRSRGLLFGSREAAEGFHSALSELLTGSTA